ncbi:hypothetical protein Peur_054036 [Populus x canadensis]
MIATRMAPLERLKLRLSGPPGHRNDSTYWEIGLFVRATSSRLAAQELRGESLISFSP